MFVASPVVTSIQHCARIGGRVPLDTPRRDDQGLGPAVELAHPPQSRWGWPPRDRALPQRPRRSSGLGRAS